MTSVSARTFGMIDRGELRTGYWADLVLFEPANIIDTATYDEPQQAPAGVGLVMVNGEVAYQDGQHTGVGSGAMLRYRRKAYGL